MTGVVFAAVLAAAVLHAGWNAIAKAIADPRVAAALLSAAGLAPAGVAAVLLPVPGTGSWPHLAVASVLSGGYLFLLVHAYRQGEFGQVYPLARGLPPLLVTMFALAVLGERLTTGQLAGVVVVSVALSVLVFGGGRPRAGSGLGLAAVAGALIAGYTLVDGVGVRASGQPLGYAAWRMLVEGTLVLAASRAIVGPGLWRASSRSAVPGLLGGLLGAVAYGTVLWAQSRAPLALVSAVRETSLLFAGVIGTVLFGERFSPARVAATVAAVGGMALLQLG